MSDFHSFFRSVPLLPDTEQSLKALSLHKPRGAWIIFAERSGDSAHMFRNSAENTIKA